MYYISVKLLSILCAYLCHKTWRKKMTTIQWHQNLHTYPWDQQQQSYPAVERKQATPKVDMEPESWAVQRSSSSHRDFFGSKCTQALWWKHYQGKQYYLWGWWWAKINLLRKRNRLTWVYIQIKYMPLPYEKMIKYQPLNSIGWHTSQ